MKKLALGFASGIALVAILGAGFVPGYKTARDPGTLNALSTTSEACFPEDAGRHGWCIKNPTSNTIDVRFRLAATVTTANGIELKPGESFCDPIGNDAVYSGVVQCIAESGTPSVITLAY